MPTHPEGGGKTDRQPRHHEIMDAYHVLQDSIKALGVLYDRVVETPPEPPAERPETAKPAQPSLAQLLADLPQMLISASEKIRKRTDQIRDNIF